jgi:hypothetical protein
MKHRWDRRVDRRKRLSHVWGRRFRLLTHFFSATRGSREPASQEAQI